MVKGNFDNVVCKVKCLINKSFCIVFSEKICV